jgi:outer membrane protein assembly factor BamD
MNSWWSRIGIILACALVAWLLLGCSSTEDEVDEAVQENKSVEELYQRAYDTFNKQGYKEAIEQFEEVDRQYPYSEWAKRAQIMAAYSAYRAQEFDEAALIIERFVKLHPNNERTPYAYYLRSLCYYDRITDTGRDQKMTEEARQALREVVSRYPGTSYARDAAIKLELTEDHLAGKEMQIGRYYLERDEYLSAINRFRFVIDTYQKTSHIPEALHRLVEAYLRLGVKEEAQKYAAVLGHNYPGSEWYEYSFQMMNGDVDPKAAKDKGWLNW